MTTDANSTRTRLDSLTGLRFFAAFLVFGFHAGAYGLDRLSFDPLGKGNTGVSFFYIVSGFVLAWSLRSGDTHRAFWQRRFARIYPAYAVAWLSAVAIMALDGKAIGASTFVPLTLLQSWVPDQTFYFAASAVFWSLSCEAFFYAVFPRLMPVINRASSKALALMTVVLIAFIAAIAWACVGSKPESVGTWLVDFFPPTRLAEFIVGIILAVAVKRGMRSPLSLSQAGVLSVAAVLVATQVPATFAVSSITLVPFMLLIVAAASADIRQRPSVFRAPVIVKLGVWSYCFYLVHTQVLAVVFELASRAGHPKEDLTTAAAMVLILVSLAAAVAASWALHVLVERPAEKRLRPKAQRDGRPKLGAGEIGQT